MSSRPPYDLYKVVAKRCELVSPNMKRLTIDCTNIPTIRPTLPAQWLKVFVTDFQTGNCYGRAYTVRNYNHATHELDLDFYLHGDTGPVGAWAMRADAGAEFEVSGLRQRSGLDVYASTKTYVLFGDETALPAISAIVESLPSTARAHAFISIADPADQAVIENSAEATVAWLLRENCLSGRLIEALEQLHLDWGSEAYFWIAGESGEVKALRKQLLSRGIPPEAIESSGYWKQGQADHREG